MFLTWILRYSVKMAEKEAEIVGQLSDSEEGSDTASTATLPDDSELALNGISLLLNNDWDQALALFNKYK